MNELIEQVARALWSANIYSENCSWDFGKGPTHMLEESKDDWRNMAKAAIEEIQSNHVIVDLETSFAIPDVQSENKS